MKPRRWFRFSLRTLLVLVTLFGVWLGVQVKWVRDRIKARQSIVASGGQIGTGDCSFPGLPSPPPSAPSGLALFGEMGVTRIWLPIDNWNARWRELKPLFPEAEFGVRIRKEPVIETDDDSPQL